MLAPFVPVNEDGDLAWLHQTITQNDVDYDSQTEIPIMCRNFTQLKCEPYYLWID